MEIQNTNANGANSWLDGISSGLTSIGDTFTQLYLARANYETIKNANRTGYAAMDQQSMLGNVPRDQQVTTLDQRRQMAEQQQSGAWLKYALIAVAGLVVYKLVK